MRLGLEALALVATLVFSGVAIAAPTPKAPPRFVYTPAVRDGIIKPILHREIPDEFSNMDIEHPIIVYQDDKVELILAWDYETGGCETYDTTFVTIVLDVKTHDVVSVEVGH